MIKCFIGKVSFINVFNVCNISQIGTIKTTNDPTLKKLKKYQITTSKNNQWKNNLWI
jgi:hypothetical protein